MLTPLTPGPSPPAKPGREGRLALVSDWGELEEDIRIAGARDVDPATLAVDRHAARMRQRQMRRTPLAVPRAESDDEMLVFARHQQREAIFAEDVPPGAGDTVREKGGIDGRGSGPLRHDLGRVAHLGVMMGP